MTAQHSPDLAQLTETVARLSEALAASERGRIASTRRLCWGAVAPVATLGVVAYAQPGLVPGMPQSWKPESLPMPLPPGAFVEQESYLADSEPSLHPKGEFQGILSLLSMLKDSS